MKLYLSAVLFLVLQTAQPPTPVLDSLLKEIDSLRRGVIPPPVTVTGTIIPAGANLQAAIDTALPGSTILLAQGVTYPVNLRLPNKVGTGTVTIRTAGLDDTVLVPGVRVTPAETRMAKLACLDCLNPTLWADSAAHDFTFIGIEFPGNVPHPDRGTIAFGYNPVTNVRQDPTTQPSNLTLDRCLVHGEPATGGHQGILLDGRNLKVLNSDIRNYWEQGRDSQAIGMIQGVGPILIENTYLEGSGENFLAGGSDPSFPNAIPSDITFRGNTVFKPLSWKTKPGTVKNLFELKNARRVLVEYNTFENVWTDGQAGAAILFTVRNQDGGCPWCTVSDVVFRYNVIKNVANFAFNILSIDNHFPTLPAARISITHNLILGASRGVQITEAIDGIEIAHNTFTGVTATFLTVDSVTGKLKGVIIRDNVTPGGVYGVAGNATGMGVPSMDAFLAPGYVFKGNVIEGNIERTIPYPVGNFSLAPGSLAAKLDSSYRYLGPEVGTDGKRPGVDPTLLRPQP